MGMFSRDYEKEAEELWESVEKSLRPKDGLPHVLMINTACGNKTLLIGKNFEYEEEYTIVINSFIEKMKIQGYDIIDIKILSDEPMSIRNVIIYK